MLTLLILLVIIVGIYAGYQRGFAYQMVYTLGYLIAFLVAKANYRALGKKLELIIPYPSPTVETKLVLFDKAIVFDLDKAFYAGFAFVLILTIGWLVVRFIGMLSYGLTFIPLLKQGNDLVGAALGGVIGLVALAIFLTLLAMLPVPSIQNLFAKSGLARGIVNHTPIISASLHDLWINKVIG